MILLHLVQMNHIECSPVVQNFDYVYDQIMQIKGLPERDMKVVAYQRKEW